MLEYINTLPVSSAHPYSAAVKAGNHIFVSPQSGELNYETNKKIATVEEQTVRCMENIKNVLHAAGASPDDIVDVVFLLNTNWTGLNTVLEPYFSKTAPARTHIITAFGDPDVLIKIGCTAHIQSK